MSSNSLLFASLDIQGIVACHLQADRVASSCAVWILFSSVTARPSKPTLYKRVRRGTFMILLFSVLEKILSALHQRMMVTADLYMAFLSF